MYRCTPCYSLWMQAPVLDGLLTGLNLVEHDLGRQRERQWHIERDTEREIDLAMRSHLFPACLNPKEGVSHWSWPSITERDTEKCIFIRNLGWNRTLTAHPPYLLIFNFLNCLILHYLESELPSHEIPLVIDSLLAGLNLAQCRLALEQALLRLLTKVHVVQAALLHRLVEHPEHSSVSG